MPSSTPECCPVVWSWVAIGLQSLKQWVSWLKLCRTQSHRIGRSRGVLAAARRLGMAAREESLLVAAADGVGI